MTSRDCPRLTRRVTADTFTPARGTGYLFASGLEERAAHLTHWTNTTDLVLVEVVNQDAARISVQIGADTHDAYLRSSGELAALFSLMPHEIYIDITGLSHHVWAPLLRAALAAKVRLWGVYVEPEEYTRTATPTEGTIYDLSEKISGIAPLPGFASLTDRTSQYLFVPILGFEGTRLIHVSEHVQAPSDATVPIIGVPGFRAEYPFVALKGNRKPLVDGALWFNLRFATANCPFDLFFTLKSVLDEFQHDHVRVAPIGTKPHGLGAVLFALSAEDRVELIYDHPIRKPGRTTGHARLCIYDVSTFVDSDEFRWVA